MIFSCSLDYSDAGLADTLAEEIPNMEIFGYNSIEIHNGSPTLKITAGEASFFNSREETRLKDVEFFNYHDGDISSHGRTDWAVLNMKTSDASLQGSILVESAENDSSIQAETLQWTEGDKTLSSGRNDSVTVRDKKGSRLSGSGFSADVKHNTILFEKEISGEIVSED